MIMQVHDELVFDVDEDRVEEVAGLAVDRMVAAYDLKPPLEVEAKVKKLQPGTADINQDVQLAIFLGTDYSTASA